MSKVKSRNLTAQEDVSEALSKFRLAALLGWQDVAQRYRRSSIGAFWLTINMGVLIGALGLVFGTIFNSPMSEFLPFICVGLILWGYYSQVINESCVSFISEHRYDITASNTIFHIYYENVVEKYNYILA